MKRILAVLVAMVSLMTLLPVVAPVSDSGSVTGTVTVLEVCDIAASPDVDFGTLTPDQTSTDQTTTVSMPTGNIVVTPMIYGTDWTGNPSGTMSVTRTHWDNTDDAYGDMDDLNLSPGETLGDTIGPGDDAIVHFKLYVPAGQTAADYTQTITFDITC